MAETEKITINLNVVDLGRIDLLVEKGHFSNRTDFIKNAIRNSLAEHKTDVEKVTSEGSYGVGITSYSRKSLLALKQRGEKLKIKLIGMVILESSITPELALDTIESIQVLGVFRAPTSVKKALANRIKVS